MTIWHYARSFLVNAQNTLVSRSGPKYASITFLMPSEWNGKQHSTEVLSHKMRTVPLGRFMSSSTNCSVIALRKLCSVHPCYRTTALCIHFIFTRTTSAWAGFLTNYCQAAKEQTNDQMTAVYCETDSYTDRATAGTRKIHTREVPAGPSASVAVSAASLDQQWSAESRDSAWLDAARSRGLCSLASDSCDVHRIVSRNQTEQIFRRN